MVDVTNVCSDSYALRAGLETGRRESKGFARIVAIENPPNPIGERLRQLRESLGFTQRQAAQKAGLTHNQWYLYEKGEVEPYFKVRKRIREAFDLPDNFFSLTSGPVGRTDQLDRIEQTVALVRQDLEVLKRRIDALWDAGRTAFAFEQLDDGERCEN